MSTSGRGQATDQLRNKMSVYGGYSAEQVARLLLAGVIADEAVKVDGALKPTSSVMIRRIFGGSLGGVTSIGHACVDCAAFGSIWPGNGGVCGGM